MHPAGFYLGGPEKNYIALRLDATTKQEGAGEPFEPLYHEYVHFLTRRFMSQLPLWMVEGLAEFYGNIRIESNRVIVGVHSDSNLEVLHQTPPLPLSTLFAVNASSPYYHEENKTSIFYAESWALTHYLMTRDWHEGTHRVTEFVNLLGQGVGADEAARRTIGDPARLQNELLEYIDRRAFTAARLDAPPRLDSKDFEAAPTSDAESLALRADFMAHNRHYQEAQEMLEEALKLDPKSAAAHESMGFIFAEQGKMDEATKWYSQAVALNSQSFLANYYYAVNLFKGMLDDDSAAKAESSLRAAIKIAPDFAPAYDALAYLLASHYKNWAEAYRMAFTALTLEPGNDSFRLNADKLAAILHAQQNQEYQLNLKGQAEASGNARSEAAAAHPPRPELLETLKRVEGIIEDAACSGTATLEVTLRSTAGAIRLYSDNRRRMVYANLNFQPKSILHPCFDIKGWHARITYHPAKAQEGQGEMVAVELIKD
jgi:tetratricopeptide (TPR) repeat protein